VGPWPVLEYCQKSQPLPVPHTPCGGLPVPVIGLPKLVSFQLAIQMSGALVGMCG
jgi:hypothetical protein